MSKERNARRIGTFVLGALILAVIAVVVIGGLRIFRAKHLAVVYFDRSVNGLTLGAPVKFKGIEIGRVESLSLDFASASSDFTDYRIPVVIDLQADLLADRGVRIALQDPAVHERMIRQGLRANLAVESYLTGILYVSLDFEDDPEPPMFFNDPAFPYPEIPTRRTTLEQVQANLSRIVERFSAADVPLLIDSFTAMAGALTRSAESVNTSKVLDSMDRTLVSVQRTLNEVTMLVDSIGGSLGPIVTQIDSTARSLRSTLAAAGATLQGMGVASNPNGPLFVRTEEAMLELARAARAIRELAEAIERNPTILLRGREGGTPQ